MIRFTCDFGPCLRKCNLICSLNSLELPNFLTNNPNVYQKAVQGIWKAQELLKESLKGLTVELFDSTEELPGQLLSITFRTTLGERHAMHQIAIFDQEWWLDNMTDVKDQLAFAIEVNVSEHVLH